MVVFILWDDFWNKSFPNSFPCFVKKSMITSPPPRQHSIIPHSKTKKNKMPKMDDSIISSHPPMQHNMGQDRRRKPSISFLSSAQYPQSPPTSHLQHNTRPHRIPPLLPPLEPCIISQLPRRQELNSNKRFSPYKSWRFVHWLYVLIITSIIWCY